MEKPILVEGPAGVGKTELAQGAGRSRSAASLIRLQCYEGLDEAKALYEWEYAKQLLYTQLLKDKIGEMVAGAGTLAEAADRLAQRDAVFFSERFLLPRPMLQALLSETPALLLIDEIDKADPEFEAFLLEVLADNAVTMPELGTFKAKHIPRVVLTSNNARELSDALKRRCLHLHIDFPDRERELRIVRAGCRRSPQALAEQVVQAVAAHPHAGPEEGALHQRDAGLGAEPGAAQRGDAHAGAGGLDPEPGPQARGRHREGQGEPAPASRRPDAIPASDGVPTACEQVPPSIADLIHEGSSDELDLVLGTAR